MANKKRRHKTPARASSREDEDISPEEAQSHEVENETTEPEERSAEASGTQEDVEDKSIEDTSSVQSEEESKAENNSTDLAKEESRAELEADNEVDDQREHPPREEETVYMDEKNTEATEGRVEGEGESVRDIPTEEDILTEQKGGSEQREETTLPPSTIPPSDTPSSVTQQDASSHLPPPSPPKQKDSPPEQRSNDAAAFLQQIDERLVAALHMATTVIPGSSSSHQPDAAEQSPPIEIGPSVATFVEELTALINEEDIEEMILLQTSTYQHIKGANESLTAFNDFSTNVHRSLSRTFEQHTRMMIGMKKDLNVVFRKIRHLRGKLEQRFPGAMDETTLVAQPFEE